ncbi:MAG TPA: glycosyltransferase family 4 protein [Fervidobacterium sp.]|nr:glycosyltransferase family 4 protein [Fervidobacterium sp.]HPT53963.1 glycosyltransferase family 4 protein [Fervidobacterium sp.]HPZ17253.1 glycosyltransferase family 4 protein [Fervidobacterium sp.]HQE48325.1 glycosyltransferase family 4 protein [Fervidobacterium sp.]HUM42007.1 glycosyltransferase family 4 protein [Fervidobacterium sp.]
MRFLKIGLMHYRVGDTDGVSLEMEKWKTVLELMGHEVHFIAGELNGMNGFQVPSLGMDNQKNLFIHSNAFECLGIPLEQLKEIFNSYVTEVEEELMALPKFDILIVNNMLSLGYNLAASVAVTEYVAKTGTFLITHNHDFYWERERYSKPTCSFVAEILETYFPPKLKDSKHVTINKIARDELKRRKGIDSTIVPNVFDFDQDEWKLDHYNEDLRERLGIPNDDIVILHATRIVERKAIEIAMDFVAQFCKLNSNVHFVVAGFPEKDSIDYYEKLKRKAEAMPFKTYFIHDLISSRRKIENGKKFYSLWDAYAICDAVTYTSILEGWGNQLIEAVFAKKPLVVVEYPVYKTDIVPLGFKFISLGSNYRFDEMSGFYRISDDILKERAEELFKLLKDADKKNQVTEYNFTIGKEHLSLQSLQKYVSVLFS